MYGFVNIRHHYITYALLLSVNWSDFQLWHHLFSTFSMLLSMPSFLTTVTLLHFVSVTWKKYFKIFVVSITKKIQNFCGSISRSVVAILWVPERCWAFSLTFVGNNLSFIGRVSVVEHWYIVVAIHHWVFPWKA